MSVQVWRWETSKEQLPDLWVFLTEERLAVVQTRLTVLPGHGLEMDFELFTSKLQWNSKCLHENNSSWAPDFPGG